MIVEIENVETTQNNLRKNVVSDARTHLTFVQP